ncbi:MAG: GlsB/YeaQ/YmgE family stress response membrane protein, partial [Aestuariivirga sp.]
MHCSVVTQAVRVAGQVPRFGSIEKGSVMSGIPGIVWTLLFGAVAGWLASLVVGGGGLIRNIIIGLIGAVVANFLFGGIGWFGGAPLLGSLLSA